MCNCGLLIECGVAWLVGLAVLLALMKYDRKPYGQHEDMP